MLQPYQTNRFYTLMLTLTTPSPVFFYSTIVLSHLTSGPFWGTRPCASVEQISTVRQGWVLARTSRYDTIDYVMIHCDTMHIAIFHRVHWKYQNRADKQVVYDLGSLKTSLHIKLIIQRTNWVKLFNLKFPFQFIWPALSNDLAAITLEWEIKFKCTLALKLDTLKPETWK